MYLIYNPVGGLGESKAIVHDKVLPVLRAGGVETVLKETEYAGHPVVLTRTLDLAGIDAVVVVGGDGTVHEAVNGMLRREDGRTVPLGFIPGGSGNSVMCDLGTWSPEEAARRVVAGDTALLDAVRVTDGGTLDVYSVNGVFWGLIGDCGAAAEQPWLRKVFGPKRYDVVATWSMFKLPRYAASVVIDGVAEPDREYTTLFANNTQHFGKGLRATPDAYMDDGAMDVCYVEAGRLPLPQLLKVFGQVPTGAHRGNPNIAMRQAQQLRITPRWRGMGVAEQTYCCNVDGEVRGFEKHLELRCLKRAVRVFAPHLIRPLNPKTGENEPVKQSL